MSLSFEFGTILEKMLRSVPKILVLLLLARFSGVAAAGSVTNCAQLVQAIESTLPTAELFPFDIRATMTATNVDGLDSFAIQDDTGAVFLTPKRKIELNARPGDRVLVNGCMLRNEFNETITHPTNVTVLSHGPQPAPAAISLADVKSGRFDHRLVLLTGVVRNIFADDVDPAYRFLALADNREVAYVVLKQARFAHQDLDGLLGATVSITGIVMSDNQSLTRQTHRKIPRLVTPVSNGIALLQPMAESREPPELSTLAHVAPEDIPLAVRHRARGRVVAVWGGGTMLLHASSGLTVRIRLARSAPPAVGDIVEVVGFPEFNLFSFGLDAATWSPADVAVPPEPAPAPASARAMMEDGRHRQKVDVGLHGRPVRITGTFHGNAGNVNDMRFLLESDGYFIPVDTGSATGVFRDIPVGSVVSVTGVCVMDIDDWKPSAVFPRVRGFSLVLRTPDDVQLVRKPAWWTPARLTALLFALLAVLLVSTLLNVLLRKLVARRERELTREISTRIASESKVHERTRLAVELHDAISQNLTGVALQLRTVATFAASLPAVASQHLTIAARTLDSCRDELRYCLWDLRSNTLEQEDMNDAIRKTITPHIGTAELTLRFNVPRAKLTDNTAHNLLHILRELATNAIRHGQATQLRIAGCLDNGKLLFSISDNGCGFNPDSCAGMESGHFGLLGVRERVESLDGEIKITSSHKGTRVSAAIPTPEDENSKI